MRQVRLFRRIHLVNSVPITLVTNSVKARVTGKDHPGGVTAAEGRANADVVAAAASDDTHLTTRAVGTRHTCRELIAGSIAVDAETSKVRSAAAHAGAAGAAGREGLAGLTGAARARTGAVGTDAGSAYSAAGPTIGGIRVKVGACATAQSLAGRASRDSDGCGDSYRRYRSRDSDGRGGDAPTPACAAIGSGIRASTRVHRDAGRRYRDRSSDSALARDDVGDSHGRGCGHGRCSGRDRDLLEARAIGRTGRGVRHLARSGAGNGTSAVVIVACCCKDAGD